MKNWRKIVICCLAMIGIMVNSMPALADTKAKEGGVGFSMETSEEEMQEARERFRYWNYSEEARYGQDGAWWVPVPEAFEDLPRMNIIEDIRPRPTNEEVICMDCWSFAAVPIEEDESNLSILKRLQENGRVTERGGWYWEGNAPTLEVGKRYAHGVVVELPDTVDSGYEFWMSMGSGYYKNITTSLVFGGSYFALAKDGLMRCEGGWPAGYNLDGPSHGAAINFQHDMGICYIGYIDMLSTSMEEAEILREQELELIGPRISEEVWLIYGLNSVPGSPDGRSVRLKIDPGVMRPGGLLYIVMDFTVLP